jgi:hypothetical protein
VCLVHDVADYQSGCGPTVDFLRCVPLGFEQANESVVVLP